MVGPTQIPLVAEHAASMTPLYPFADQLGARGILIARSDGDVTAGRLVTMRCEPYGWELDPVVAAGQGDDDVFWTGVVLESVAASRGSGPGFSKARGEWVKVLVYGAYNGVTLPNSQTTSSTDLYLGWTGTNSALAAGSDAKDEAVFAEDIGTVGAGTTKNLFFFGRPCYT